MYRTAAFPICVAVFSGFLILAGCSEDESASSSAEPDTDMAAAADAGGGDAVADAGAGGGMAAPAQEGATISIGDDEAMGGGGGMGAAMGGGGGMEEAMGGGGGMEEAMGGNMAGYAGNGEPGYEGGGQRNQQPQTPPRPDDVATWTAEQVLDAARERDTRLPAAVQAKVQAAPGDAAVVQLLQQILVVAAQAQQPQQGQFNQGYEGYDPGAGMGIGTGLPGDPASDAGLPGAPTSSGGPGPSDAPPPLPGGGASIRSVPGPHSAANDAVSVSSLEIMLAEAIVGFVPQATQGIRGAGERIQQRAQAQGQNVQSQSGGVPSSGPPSSGPPGGGVPGAPSSGYPGGVPSSGPPSSGPPGGGVPGAPSSGNPGGYPGGVPSSGPPSSGAPGTSAGGYPGTGAPSSGLPGSGGYPGAGGYPGSGGMQPGMEMGGEMGLGLGAGGNRGGNRNGGALDDITLVTTVVQGLVDNNSFPAWKTIQDILSGTVKTPLDSATAAQIVINQVFTAKQFNRLMAQQLIIGTLQNPGRDPQSLSSIRMLTAVNADLGRHYLYWPALAQSEDNNRGVQGGFMGTGGPGQIDEGMGFAGPGAPGGEGAGYAGGPGYEGGGDGSGAPPPPRPDIVAVNLPVIALSREAVPAAADLLWSPEVRQVVVSRLNSAPVLDAETVGFASTIPSADVRAGLYQSFLKHHETGAGPIAGILAGAATDPGVLAVLKTLPRQRPKTSRGGNLPPPPGPEESWVHVTEAVVMQLRDRLRAAAVDPALAYDGVPKVRLHRNAETEVAIAIVLPDNASAQLGAAAPADTRVYYTRSHVSIEREIQKQDIAKHYESRTKGFIRPNLQKGILWFDGVRKNPDGTIDTMDVVIEQASRPQGGAFGGGGGFAGGGGQGGSMFTIEVIVVSTSDPGSALDAATASTN